MGRVEVIVVPNKEYSVLLAPDCRLVVSIQMIGGKVVSFVVRLVRICEDVERDVARYDTAHGIQHMARLTWMSLARLAL